MPPFLFLKEGEESRRWSERITVGFVFFRQNTRRKLLYRAEHHRLVWGVRGPGHGMLNEASSPDDVAREKST